MKHAHAHLVRCPLGGAQCPSGGRADTDMRHIISVLLENEPGRVVTGGGIVLGARLQHRDPDGGADRGCFAVAHDDRQRRLGRCDRADHQALEPADRGREGGRPDRGRLHRTRADADQGARGRQGARGDEADGGHLPRPHHRRHRAHLHDRADRQLGQARCIHPGRRPRVDPGNSPTPAARASDVAKESCGSERFEQYERGVSDEGFLRQGR